MGLKKAIKNIISQNLVNIPGWRTKRRIIVIESDDWGSIRMPSKEVYSRFVSKGFNISNSDYNRFDSLESNDDLSMLYEVLYSYKDHRGNHPVITANFVVANPDFRKIALSGFMEYFFEPVSETLKYYPGREKVQDLWITGNNSGIFHPQFHSREHVNITRWMEALRKRTAEIMFTFDNRTTFSGDGDYNFMEVLDYNTPEDLLIMKQSIAEGLSLFEELFGFRSKSFIPPCYSWSSEIERTLHDGGVRYIQGLAVQLVPTGSFGNYRKKYHYLGETNAYNQVYLIRNCFFEPTLMRSSDPVGECLNRIKISFKWNKPAILTSHRINYIGSLDERNRKNNLRLFNDLLKQILKYWPETEFMTSDQLGDTISEDKKK